MNILYILDFCLIMSNNFKTRYHLFKTRFHLLKTSESFSLVNTCAANLPVKDAGYTGPPRIAKQSFYLFILTVF